MARRAVEPPLVLASASPRRQALLARAGIRFETVPARIEERRQRDESPRAFAERLARQKALAVARRFRGPGRLVLGADTIVVLDEAVLGKPSDPEQAVELLRRLAGREHRVITAVAVAGTGGGSAATRVVESRVTLRDASEREIRAYVAAGESLDKAGAYAAQGEGRRFIARIDGSETNVIGLPVEETLELLREAGFPLGQAA